MDAKTTDLVERFQQTIEPLKNLGVPHVTVQCQIKERLGMAFSNHPKWQKDLCLHTELWQPLPCSSELLVTEFALWSRMQRTPFYKRALHDYGIRHGITLLARYKETLKLFHFGTIASVVRNNEWYVEHLYDFQTFVQNFSSKADKLMVTASEIKLPDNNIFTTLTQKRTHQANKTTQQKHYPLYNGHYLTYRQAECAVLAGGGKPLKSIAKEMHISVYTVRTLIEQAKKILGCQNTASILLTLQQEGVWKLLKQDFPEQASK